MKDLYLNLGIDKNSDQKTIKKAYHKLAMKHHPDRGGIPEKFREISEAYHILSNNDKKILYDNFGYDSLYESEQSPDFSFDPMEIFKAFFAIDDIKTQGLFFTDLSSINLKANNHKIHKIDVTLDELYNGVQKTVHIHHNTQSGPKSTKYVINIQKGSKHKDSILVPKGGNYLADFNYTEDLLIQLNVLEDNKYKRNNDDLISEENITLCEALTGANIIHNHFSGPITINIEEIINPNKIFKIEGKGMPIKGEDNSYGNLLLHLNIIFPNELSEKQKELLSKILYHPKQKNEGTIVKGIYFKDKNDIEKELCNDEENIGCIQQ